MFHATASTVSHRNIAVLAAVVTNLRRVIHIVTHETAVRTRLRSLLSADRPMPVLIYADAETFLARREDIDPGVVLLDGQLPGMGGMAMLEGMAARWRRFVPIVMTDERDVVLTVRAMKLGATDVLLKPIDEDQLRASVDAALALLDAERSAAQATRAARARVERLSRRERDVFAGLLRGSSNKIIAYQLDLSPRTVEIHRAKMMDKLGARTLSQALRIAFDAQLLDEMLSEEDVSRRSPVPGPQ